MKVREALSYLREELVRIEEKIYAQQEAQDIIAHFLNISPLNVYLHLEKDVPFEALHQILKERLTGKPLPYILKKAFFFGRAFYIEEGVLIPRGETELIVEVFLQLGIEEGWILELGCGSGIISITLLLERPKLKVLAVDVSSKALTVAKINAQKYQVEERLFLIRGNWLSSLKEQPLFKAIISNPPYLSLEEWETLPWEVKDFEPKEALIAGPKGTEYQEIIIREGYKYLYPQGFILFEMGYNQAPKIEELIHKSSYKIFKDLLGYPRVVLIWRED
ncbi:MAG: peptide chain release factor N(5)-glutamine methyltransferase [Caldimicrobium sp.]|nr:peptide chain release factor N(5)-glutamine methyltransferase [Caldimicrobium sp.]MCX7873734.1 peptide chain release factor N(5)-glutamine methyltransferase [Caldimicrobium sp.]MDW8093658.1 peptide chain release factor N(5)-glutamine methyltransferase [Caldimicrobium sp.]